MKNPMRLALALGGACFVSVLLTPACVVVTRGGPDFVYSSTDWPEKVERTETRALAVAAGQTLRAETPYGSIRVRASADGSASMHAVVRAAGRTQADAQALLDRAQVVVEETDRGVSLRLEVARDASDSDRRPQPAVDFEIELPADVALELVSRSGPVQAEGGPFGPARLESSYGSVQVENVRGDVSATSKSGRVDVAHVSQGSVTASSGYGAVSVVDVDAGAVSAKSSSGHVQLARVKARRVTAESGYGAVGVREAQVEHEIEARSKSGSVTAESVKAARVQLGSGYGPIRVSKVEGDLSLETSSGSISVVDVRGALAAKTGYGSIDVDGVLSVLALESKSGSVKAHARAESSVDSEWTLTSSYGRVELRAPKDLAFDLSARTGYGQIEVGYALQVAPGALGKNGREIQGSINGGGKTVRLKSASGNVVVTPTDS